MKKKIFFFSFSILLISGVSFAQKGKAPKSIINENVAIKKFHERDELDGMQKGQLLVLYTERIKVITRILPYIAFATKPGITMSNLGIPNNKKNRKVLENEFKSTADYLENTVEFQKKTLPYSDRTNIIAAILFYEDTLKALHEYSEFN